MSNAVLNRTKAAETKPGGTRGNKSLFNRRNTVATLVAATVIGGGVAFAYPPDMGLEVSAQASPASSGASTATVTVTIKNNDPQCSHTVSVANGTPSSKVYDPNQTTSTFEVPNTPGTRPRVAARTVKPCNDSEHAHSRFVVSDAHASGPAHSPLKQNAAIEYTGLTPKATISATAMLSGGGSLPTEYKKVGNDGTATIKFKFKQAGTWTIMSTSNGTAINSVVVQVP